MITRSNSLESSDAIKAEQTTSREQFYGWRMVVAGMAILFVSSGVGFYCHGVVLDPLRSQHGWSKGIISSAISLYFVVTGIIGFLIGKKVDKYGPKPILIIGSIIFGLVFTLLGFIQEVWQLYVLYFFLAVGWTGTSLLPINTLIANWFIRKRGFAMSLTMTGLSVGGIVLVPSAVFMIQYWGLKLTLATMGATFWVIIIPIALFFIKQKPSEVNQFPDGDPPNLSSKFGSTRGALQYESQNLVWTRSQAIKTAAFWSIVISFTLALAAQIAYMVHQISFLGQYLGVNGAAIAVSLTAGASIIGRLILGTFVDRIDQRYAIIFCFLLQAIAVFSLTLNQHWVVLYTATFVFGVTMGSILMMQSLIIGECFGIASFAAISGLAGLFILSGAALGPMIAGFIYDATLSYRIAFLIFAAVSVIAAVFIIFAKPPNHPSTIRSLPT